MPKQKSSNAPNASTAAANHFWNACRAGRLELQRCTYCATVRYPPAPCCPACLSEGSDWRRMSGNGTVYSYVVYRHAFRSQFAAELPYVVALVDLEEGVRMVSRIVGCAPDEVSIGMRVQVRFQPLDGDLIGPVFTPMPS